MTTTEMSWAELDEALKVLTDKAADSTLTPAEERKLARLERAMERRDRGRW